MIIDKIKKAIELVRKTGDKIILFEEERSDGVVIMSMEEYERLSGVGESRNQTSAVGTREDDQIGSLTEDELIDRINRNIAAWQSQNQNQLDEYKVIESFLSEPEEEEEEVEDNLYYYSEENLFYPFQSGNEGNEEESEEESKDKEEGKGEKKEEEVQEDPGSQEPEDQDKKSNWEIPINIKKDAEEVEE